MNDAGKSNLTSGIITVGKLIYGPETITLKNAA